MNNIEKLAEMEDFITSNGQVSWIVIKGEPVYGLIERVLKGQSYSRLSKGQKGFVRRFLSKVTGLSRAQTARLSRLLTGRFEYGWTTPRRRRYPLGRVEGRNPKEDKS